MSGSCAQLLIEREQIIHSVDSKTGAPKRALTELEMKARAHVARPCLRSRRAASEVALSALLLASARSMKR